MFPGQGSQYIGMGSSIIKEYPSLQRYYDIASDILGYNLQNICENGPKEKLDSTVWYLSYEPYPHEYRKLHKLLYLYLL